MPLGTPDPIPVDVPAMLAELEEHPREFRLAWRWRRLLWLAGFAPLVYLTAILLIHTVVRGLPLAPQSSQDLWLSAGNILLPLLLSAWCFHKAWAWRVRIDREGISWRRRWCWRRWTWQDFAEGKLQRQRDATGGYIDVGIGQTLDLGFLSVIESRPEVDFQLVNSICLAFWAPPPLDLPDELTVKVETGIAKHMRVWLHAEGVSIVEREIKTTYSWNGVRARFLRLDDRHPAFQILHLVVSERDIRLSALRGSRNWKGPDATCIGAFLQQHLAPEQVEEATIAWPPQTRLDVELQREAMELDYRTFKLAGCATAVLMMFAPLIDYDWLLWIGLPFVLLVGGYEAYDIRRRRRAFADALRSFDEQ